MQISSGSPLSPQPGTGEEDATMTTKKGRPQLAQTT
jgi:hypothetical protein